MKYISAVSYKINDTNFALIYPVNQGFLNSPDSVEDGLNLIFEESKENKKIYIEYSTDDEYNIEPLRLRETIRYCCRIVGNSNIKINLDNEINKLLNIERDNDRVIFQFVNYLGKTNITFKQNEKLVSKLSFEVVPDKIKYKEDYIELTKAIADECNSLLLDISSPTTHSFTTDIHKEATVLEQFIFLRSFCYAENIESLFASIKRNPDKILVNEDDMKPFGMGLPSSNFYSNPFSNSRGWFKTTQDYYCPTEISVSHKYDSFDTPANRFIKQTLLCFSEVCERVINTVETEKSDYKKEAENLLSKIEDVLNDPFFTEIGDLDIMPVNNQVLEKREGYNQLFNAFAMLNLALHIEWRERDNVYNGEIKNTALLYEYWLFFELRKILIELSGKVINSSKDEPCSQFIDNKNDFIISLKQGTSSIQTFIFDEKVKVNLYYNKTFSPTQFNNSVYWGSYSRPFRPDYTLAIFPNDYKNEKEAIKAGEVSYVHFDAKYRVQDLTKFINSEKLSVKDENFDSVENKISDDLAEELNEEKNESITNTYKRGDLLKMHTYNDAIRRTVGSYILYPGTTNSEKDSEKTSVYDEILPGVGAFAIRPGNYNKGHEEIKQFIYRIIQFKETQVSRIYRKDYFENMVIQAPGENSKITFEGTSSKDYTMIGFVRNEYYKFLIKNQFLPISREEFLKKDSYTFYFYFYAIKKGKVYTLHKETSKSKFLKITTTDVQNFKYKYEHLEPWTAEIESMELVSKDTLQEKLNSLYSQKQFIPKNGFNADFYYLVKASVKFFDEGIKDVVIVEDEAISPYSPKIIELPRGNMIFDEKTHNFQL